jgi:YD repeat-containing protein
MRNLSSQSSSLAFIGGTAVTRYAYDVQDHLVKVTDAENGVTTYVYLS